VFNCAICKETSAPGVKPATSVTGIRKVEYHNEYVVEDEWGNKEKREVDSVGTEIVHEEKICPQCAARAYDVQAPNKPSVERSGAHSFQEKPADPMRVTLIACAVHSALDRLNHDSKRAVKDCEVVVPAVKRFTDHNPKFLF
jgi:hypothetical protein